MRFLKVTPQTILDEAGLDIIYAEPVPETGLGRAIMDKLRRASEEHLQNNIEE